MSHPPSSAPRPRRLGDREATPLNVLEAPLKLLRLDLLKRAGLPVPDGWIVDPELFFATKEQKKAFCCSIEPEADPGPWILRSLDDDFRSQAGLTDSLILHRLHESFAEGLQTILNGYHTHQAKLERKNFSRIMRYARTEEFEPFFRGETPHPFQNHPMALLQRMHVTPQSGVCIVGSDQLTIHFADEMQLSSLVSAAQTLVLPRSGGHEERTRLSKDVGLSPTFLSRMQGFADEIVNTLTPYELGHPLWIVEFCGSLRTHPGDIHILQARPQFLFSEREVNPQETPEIFRFFQTTFPFRAKVKVISCKEDLLEVRRHHLVVARLDQRFDFSCCAEVPRGIFVDSGTLGQHDILRITAIKVLSAKPAFFEELLRHDGALVEIGFDFDRGRLTLEQGNHLTIGNMDVQTNHFLKQQDEHALKGWIKTTQTHSQDANMHPDRSPEDWHQDHFSTVVSGVRLVFATQRQPDESLLPPRKALMQLSNQQICQLMLGPLRLAMSIYPGLILAMEEQTPHWFLAHRFLPLYGPQWQQEDSIRLWNCKGPVTTNPDFPVPLWRKEKDPYVRLDNRCSGLDDFGDPGRRSPALPRDDIFPHLRTLKLIQVPFEAIQLQVHKGFPREPLAAAMANDPLFSPCDQFLAMELACVPHEGNQWFLLPYALYRQAIWCHLNKRPDTFFRTVQTLLLEQKFRDKRQFELKPMGPFTFIFRQNDREPSPEAVTFFEHWIHRYGNRHSGTP